jgi:hypothetical protein
MGPMREPSRLLPGSSERSGQPALQPERIPSGTIDTGQPLRATPPSAASLPSVKAAPTGPTRPVPPGREAAAPAGISPAPATEPEPDPEPEASASRQDEDRGTVRRYRATRERLRMVE